MQTQTPTEQLRERHAKELQTLNRELEIVALLPDTLPSVPSISNVREPREASEPCAWLSFSTPYGADAKAHPVAILQALEAAGAEVVPATLCKWDRYRRAVEAGAVEDMPKTNRSGHELNDCDPIAPLWIEPCQFTAPDAECFYRIGGQLFSVSVDIPRIVYLHCRKVENMGGWRFEGSASVRFPESWKAIHGKASELVAEISKHTAGFRDTEQGISGRVYWNPIPAQTSFPLTPAQMLA